MTSVCIHCRKPRLELGKPPVATIASRVYETIVALGGQVETQNHLMAELAAAWGMGRGTAQRYIDRMAAHGFLRVEYHGDGNPAKRIIAVRPPRP